LTTAITDPIVAAATLIVPVAMVAIRLLSGNECAFPGCRQPVISDNGTLIAQIVHIEAAMPGGGRYNASMTDEDRRAFENLMVLCYHITR
jgi:hypothetical protein